MAQATTEHVLPTSIVKHYHSGSENHIKPHDIVFASLKLTPKMCDVLSILFTKMREQDWFVDGEINSENHAVPRYEFTAKELTEFFGKGDSKNIASMLRAPVRSLTETVIGLEKDNGEFDYAPLFSRCKYEKGTLTITPNNELRDSYIAKAKSKGYALINNEQYLALSDAHSKKTLDLLSRFKTGNKLFPISIRKLQIIYGVYGRDGVLQMPTYKSPKTFVTRLIASSLKTIANSPQSQSRIEILTSERDGTLGYELVDGEGENARIKFLYRWTACFTDEEIEQSNIEIERLLLENSKRIQENQSIEIGLTMDELLVLKKHVEIAMTESEDDERNLTPILVKVIDNIEKVQKDLDEYEAEKEADSKSRILDLARFL